jgi:pimeloyl-ACP methyl ester carboxylesterase
LVNKVANPHLDKPKVEATFHMSSAKSIDKYKPSTLTMINRKPLYYIRFDTETSRPPVVFLHGLGSSNDYFEPLIYALKLRERHALHAFDFEGHGLSPTSPLSKLSIGSLAEDLNGVFEHAKITSKAIIVAHGMSCLVAMSFTVTHPELVAKLVLLGPPPSPLPDIERLNMLSRVHSARANGMLPAAKMDSISATSRRTRETNPLANTAIKLSLLGQDAEGYAKALQALVNAKEIEVGAIEAKTLIVAGSEDENSPPQTCEAYGAAMKNASVRVLGDVGHWHIFEDCSGVANAMEHFLEES